MNPKEQPELKKDEFYCDKCKRVVHKSEFHEYFGVCNKCIDNKGTGRGK